MSICRFKPVNPDPCEPEEGRDQFAPPPPLCEVVRDAQRDFKMVFRYPRWLLVLSRCQVGNLQVCWNIVWNEMSKMRYALAAALDLSEARRRSNIELSNQAHRLAKELEKSDSRLEESQSMLRADCRRIDEKVNTHRQAKITLQKRLLYANRESERLQKDLDKSVRQMQKSEKQRFEAERQRDQLLEIKQTLEAQVEDLERMQESVSFGI